MTARIATTLLLSLLLNACGDFSQAAPTGPPGEVSEHDAASLPFAPPSAMGQERIKDRHIVWLHDGSIEAPKLALEVQRRFGAEVDFIYEHAIQGFAATLSDSAVAALSRNNVVQAIVPDAVAMPFSDWGLDRIDQRELPLSGSYTPSALGTNEVHAYVIDSGIYKDHSEFSPGQVLLDPTQAFDAFRDTSSSHYADDCYGQQEGGIYRAFNGHGTHVAGIIGGSSYGAMPTARLHSVRVIDCSEYTTVSSILAGVDWVTANFSAPAVANMSLGAEYSSASDILEAGIRASVNAGVTYVVAAGNFSQNACDYSPARMPEVITVAASTASDQPASFSNSGSCIDVFAPGEGITSAIPYDSTTWTECSTCTAPKEGTSMATPFVTAVAGRWLSANPNASPTQVWGRIKSTATTDKLSAIGSGSPNRLVFNPRPLSTDVEGPSSVTDDTTVIFLASPEGGHDNYTYLWEHRYHYPDGYSDPWASVGSDPTVSIQIMWGSPDFELRLTVSSVELQAQSHQYVSVECEGACVESGDGDVPVESEPEAGGES